MSLMKSFNFKFFKENIRKSKGIVIFSLLIIPVLTALVLLKGYADINSYVVLKPSSISGANLLLMAIIPFVYTNIFFGFVYKKKSTDFMNSMPLSRKTVYVSNTFGGIILITIMQILTAVITIGCGALSSSLYVLPSVVLSTLGVMWLSYVFMFMANNLAMTISGTQMTQFVVAVCILFIIPFSYDCIYEMAKVESGNFGKLTIVKEDDSEVSTNIIVTNHYTLPYGAIKGFGQYDEIVSTTSIVKTLVLSVVYFYLGLHFYLKRKMENNEEPFATYKAHLTLKTITLIPILLVLNLINSSGGDIPFIIMIVFLVIYYIVYDFIIKRKVPFGVTLVSMVTSITVLEIFILGIRAGSAFLQNKTLELDDISSIAIDISSDSSWYEYSHGTKLSSEKFFIKDEDFKETVVNSLKQIYTYSYSCDTDEQYYYSYDTSSAASSSDISSATIYFKTKLGKVYSGEFYLNNYTKIVNVINKNEDYIEYLNKMVAKKGVVILDDKEVGSSIEKALNKALKENKLSYSDLESSSYSLKKYIYVNNEVQYCNIPVDLTDELLKAVAKDKNSEAKKLMNKSSRYSYSGMAYYSSGNSEYIQNSDELFEFVLECAGEEFDETKSYVVINMTINGEEISVFTNNIKEFKKIRKIS